MAKPLYKVGGWHTNINYERNIISVSGIEYSLDDLREYLLAEWNMLTLKHFIKWLFLNGEMTAKYDWSAIFSDVEQAYFPLLCFARTAKPMLDA